MKIEQFSNDRLILIISFDIEIQKMIEIYDSLFIYKLRLSDLFANIFFRVKKKEKIEDNFFKKSQK